MLKLVKWKNIFLNSVRIFPTKWTHDKKKEKDISLVDK